MPKPNTGAAAERPDDLAVLAAMELLDAGWGLGDIAAALRRDEAWLAAEIARAAPDALADPPPLN